MDFNNLDPRGLIGSCKTNFLPVFSLTSFSNFFAIPCFLNIGFTNIYSTSPLSSKRTNPSVVFSFLRVKTPSVSDNSYLILLMLIIENSKFRQLILGI